MVIGINRFSGALLFLESLFWIVYNIGLKGSSNPLVRKISLALAELEIFWYRVGIWIWENEPARWVNPLSPVIRVFSKRKPRFSATFGRSPKTAELNLIFYQFCEADYILREFSRKLEELSRKHIKGNFVSSTECFLVKF